MTDLEKEMLRQIHELSKEVTALRERVAVVESKMFVTQKGQAAIIDELNTLRAALAEPTVKESLQVELVPEPGDFDHAIGADRFRVVRGAFWWHVLIGDSPTEHGKFHSRASAEKMAADLLREFRNGAFVQHEAALADPVQEPVACHVFNVTVTGSLHEWEPTTFAFALRDGKHALYTSPPQRKPLSDADLAKIWDDALDQLDPRDQLRFIARAIERAHGIGGQQ